MKKLEKHEVLLAGKWEVRDGKVVSDSVVERIDWLTANVLKKICDHPSDGAWSTLFKDPADGRFWERVYLSSEMHGGGPPTLRNISVNQVAEMYKI